MTNGRLKIFAAPYGAFSNRAWSRRESESGSDARNNRSLHANAKNEDARNRAMKNPIRSQLATSRSRSMKRAKNRRRRSLIRKIRRVEMVEI